MAMNSNKYVDAMDYGSAKALAKDTKQKVDEFGKTVKESELAKLILCLFLPCALFAMVFYLRSFDLRYSSPQIVEIASYLFFAIPLVLIGASFISRAKSDLTGSLGIIVLGWSCLIACILGYFAGDVNYHWNMRQWYEIKEFNKYPSVDPGRFTGNSFMDAGEIDFTKGSRVAIERSAGFKNGNVYCVAPIVNGSHIKPHIVDFWAVGINCCSQHIPDFYCGEYSNPSARKGLRILDTKDQEMFRLVVKKAEAQYQFRAPHPVLLHWMEDPSAEINAWETDGYTFFTLGIFAYFCIQAVVVLFAMLLHMHLDAVYKFLRRSYWRFLFE